MLNEYSSLVPLSYVEHAHMGWRYSPEQVLANTYKWLPISLSEMARASAHFPIVIIKQGLQWSIVVLLDDSIGLGANLQTSGELEERLIPICLQAYPFAICSSQEARAGAQLCIEASSLASLQEIGTLPLFRQNRQFSTTVTDRFHLLHRMKIDAEIVHSACELLAKKGILVLISDAERLLTRIKDHSMPLYRIDIDAIARLSREDFADLQMHHAMVLGIYQYSSLFHVSKFHHHH